MFFFRRVIGLNKLASRVAVAAIWVLGAIGAFCFSISAARAQSRDASAAGPTDPLQSVISLGIKRAFSIDSQRLRLAQAINQQKITRAALLPTVTLSSSRAFSGGDQFDSVGKWSYSNTTTDQLRVTANWTLWDNYQNIRNVQTGALALESERASSRIQVQKYIVDLLDTYLEYQLLLRQREILRSAHETNILINEESQSLVKVGAKTRLDAMDAEIQVANSERDLIELENTIRSAERNLQALINSDKLDLPRLDLLTFKPYYVDQFNRALTAIRKEISDRISDVNPDLQAKRIDLEKSRLVLKQKKLEYWPQTTVSLSHDLNLDTFQNPNPPYGQRNAAQSSSIQLLLSWKFWDWLATPYGIENSQKDFDISVNNYKETRLSKQAEVANSLAQLDILDKTIEASELVVEKAEAQLEYSQEMYRLGRITLLSMQQSASRVREARNALASRLKARYISIAKLMQATGRDLTPPGLDLSWLQ